MTKFKLLKIYEDYDLSPTNIKLIESKIIFIQRRFKKKYYKKQLEINTDLPDDIINLIGNFI